MFIWLFTKKCSHNTKTHTCQMNKINADKRKKSNTILILKKHKYILHYRSNHLLVKTQKHYIHRVLIKITWDKQFIWMLKNVIKCYGTDILLQITHTKNSILKKYKSTARNERSCSNFFFKPKSKSMSHLQRDTTQKKQFYCFTL